MSVGFFLGIRESYTEEAVDTATAYIAAINRALATAGLPRYLDPETPADPYDGNWFGNSQLDHHSGSCLIRLGSLAATHGISGHFSLLASNPYRVAFLPHEFPAPLPTDHTESLWEKAVQLWVGSAPGLLREALALAPHLGIPLHDGALDAEVAHRLSDMEPLRDGEDHSLVEDLRTAWLLVHEGARLSIEHGVALSLAG